MREVLRRQNKENNFQIKYCLRSYLSCFMEELYLCNTSKCGHMFYIITSHLYKKKIYECYNKMEAFADIFTYCKVYYY